MSFQIWNTVFSIEGIFFLRSSYLSEQINGHKLLGNHGVRTKINILSLEILYPNFRATELNGWWTRLILQQKRYGIKLESVFQTDTFKTLFVDYWTSLIPPFSRWVTGKRIPLKLCSNWQAILILTVAQFFTSSVFANHFWIMCWILPIPFSRDDSISQFWEPVLTIDCHPVCLALHMQVLHVDIITMSVGFQVTHLAISTPKV